jgi:hypothetical protein
MIRLLEGVMPYIVREIWFLILKLIDVTVASKILTKFWKLYVQGVQKQMFLIHKPSNASNAKMVKFIIKNCWHANAIKLKQCFGIITNVSNATILSISTLKSNLVISAHRIKHLIFSKKNAKNALITGHYLIINKDLAISASQINFGMKKITFAKLAK